MKRCPSVFGCVLVLFLLLQAIGTDGCTKVSLWKDLKQQARQGHGRIVFCPFRLRKPSHDQIIIAQGNITFACEEPRQCVLGGSGRHFTIKADGFVLDGFVLREATESALHFAPSMTPRTHEISNGIFRTNHMNGAVRVKRNNSLRITGCLFQDNRSNTIGGAIAFYGRSLHLESSSFLENIAMEGGAIFFGPGTKGQSLNASNLEFISNSAAAVKESGALSIPLSKILSSGSDSMSGADNGGCNGWFDRSSISCVHFVKPSDTQPFKLGLLSSKTFHGIRVSQGLSLRRIAQSGQTVFFMSNETKASASTLPFHFNPDGAHIFENPGGGFTYVSNSEEPNNAGGVYALDFDSRGFIRNYRRLLNGTSRNCNGGSTPWDTWVSCEEVPDGRCWQVDPFGDQKPNPIRIGKGEFEAFATDARDPNNLAFFITEDQSDGALRRYRPPTGTEMKWPMLHNANSTLDFLEFVPGTKQFRWTSSLRDGRESARMHYQFTEGIACHNGSLMFVSKTQKELFRLDLDTLTYTAESTFVRHMEGGGSFGNGPDHLLYQPDGSLYFTEDGGSTPGIYVYNGSKFWTVIEAASDHYVADETTGIAFSPDGRFLIFCIQEQGHCFQASRIDGEPFGSKNVLRWKYNLVR